MRLGDKIAKIGEEKVLVTRYSLLGLYKFTDSVA